MNFFLRLEDDCPDSNLWTKASKVTTPSAPYCTPVRGSLENNPSIVLYHPSPSREDFDVDQDEEIVVPLVFDNCLDFDGRGSVQTRDVLSPAFFPQEQVCF